MKSLLFKLLNYLFIILLMIPLSCFSPSDSIITDQDSINMDSLENKTDISYAYLGRDI